MIARQPFPIDVQTGWADYSPALTYYASQRIRARLAEFGSRIQSVTVRVSDDEPRNVARRRCAVEVTTHAEKISAASTGVNLFALVDRAVYAVVELLRQSSSGEAHREPRRRVA